MTLHRCERCKNGIASAIWAIPKRIGVAQYNPDTDHIQDVTHIRVLKTDPITKEKHSVRITILHIIRELRLCAACGFTLPNASVISSHFGDSPCRT